MLALLAASGSRCQLISARSGAGRTAEGWPAEYRCKSFDPFAQQQTAVIVLSRGGFSAVNPCVLGWASQDAENRRQVMIVPRRGLRPLSPPAPGADAAEQMACRRT